MKRTEHRHTHTHTQNRANSQIQASCALSLNSSLHHPGVFHSVFEGESVYSLLWLSVCEIAGVLCAGQSSETDSTMGVFGAFCASKKVKMREGERQCLGDVSSLFSHPEHLRYIFKG